ncbi:tRNA (adenosine(37)-N6)-threonylcarbamoyltransferase complex dimerization subunit type 1 TsaB [Spirosoma montaniterrae]|uniref:tRNA threonylcarbamoyladenosine biosynthesis protein TsaB n=1 Tax=Spirosoma montaniterrae TaxID=1178516 RepID=A0A1P9WRP9_9BACT|nr:tRNA (adenosine(37)-N6)-threonylcarbamoyltransferase complex dimerization subunit type 1 TsaB [Spirosoma montaniterrae]AQG78052.1 tRNA threonylcarbamoyladenosine biosynthesis protein TsaB [Spirosoma montaniterrae]
MILSIDTSTTVCSVALHEGDKLLGCYELYTERTSAAMLTTLIDNVVRHTGHELSALDAIAVAKGPGSYTGLRIGVSTAKGLCFALDKPLLAINTLQALTEQVRLLPHPQPLPLKQGEGGFYCPMIDARRMEVYCAMYDADGREVQPTSAQIIDEQSFAEWLERGSVLFFGDGAAKCRPVLGNHPNAQFLDQVVQPSARTVGALASVAFAEGRFENVATFEPYYLKEFMTTVPKRLVV